MDVLDPLVQASAIEEASMQASFPEPRTMWPMARWFNGEKFFGGMGPPNRTHPNYYELRIRSHELFDKNQYARGVVRRLVRSIISTGLMLEATPVGPVLGMSDDEAADWADTVEQRWKLYTHARRVVDWKKAENFEALERRIYREALVGGDVLVVLHYPRRDQSGVPRIELVNGSRVTTPWKIEAREGRRIEHGVELNEAGEHVGYWVVDKDGEHRRVSARGPKSGRTLAFLVYGVDRRHERVRGTPLLSIIMQSINEIDRYRDSEQRAATVNSLLAMVTTRDRDGVPTMPMSRAAVRKEDVSISDEYGVTDLRAMGQVPGVVVDALGAGEQIHSFNTQRPNVNFAAFEAAVVHAIAWSLEIPPEVLTLAFQNNYSASKAANAEYKEFVTGERKIFGEQFCSIVYEDWFIAEVANDNIVAPGFLDAYVRGDWATVSAWTVSQWGGPVKPSMELARDVRAYKEAVEAGACTLDRMSQDLFGMRFRTVVKKLKRELELLVEAREPLREAMPDPAAPTPGSDANREPATAAQVIELMDALDDLKEASVHAA